MDINKELLDTSLRQITQCADIEMRPYDRYGEPRADMDWFPFAGSVEEGFECFLLRIKPEASSTPHEHSGYEQFLMLDGDLTDWDGTVFKAGDCVSFEPGSRHYSSSKDGCTLLVMLHGQNYALK